MALRPTSPSLSLQAFFHSSSPFHFTICITIITLRSHHPLVITIVRMHHHCIQQYHLTSPFHFTICIIIITLWSHYPLVICTHASPLHSPIPFDITIFIIIITLWSHYPLVICTDASPLYSPIPFDITIPFHHHSLASPSPGLPRQSFFFQLPSITGEL